MVTNHALLAIDAITGIAILPEHDVVVIDEAHELVDRVTGVATAELSASAISAAARRCGKIVEEQDADRLEAAAEGWSRSARGTARRALGRRCPTVRRWRWPRSATRPGTLRTAIGPAKPGMAAADPEAAPPATRALSAIDEMHDSAVRILTAFDEPDPAKRKDVVWLSSTSSADGPAGRSGWRRCRWAGCCARACSPSPPWC